MKGQTPTARTLVALRKSGYLAAVVEHWIPQMKIRRDLFGIGDVLAVRAGEPGSLLIQATTVNHISHRRVKAQAEKNLRVWLSAPGNRFEIWGWEKNKKTGRWSVRREELTPDGLRDVEIVLKIPRRRKPKPDGLFEGMA